MRKRSISLIQPLPERSGGGFSLVELIVVMVIIGIVSGVAIGSSGPSRQVRHRAGAHMIVKDFLLARERAIATGATQWIRMDPSDFIEYLQGSTLAAATPLIDSTTGTALRTNLGAQSTSGAFVGVDFSAWNGATISSAVSFGFDWLGRPVNSSGANLTTASTLTVTASGFSTITITVAPDSGSVSAVYP